MHLNHSILRLSTFLFLFFLSSDAYSQNLDSLKNVVATSTSTIERQLALTALTEHYLINNLDSVDKFQGLYEKEAKSHPTQHNQFALYQRYGTIQLFRGDTKLAQIYADSAAMYLSDSLYTSDRLNHLGLRAVIAHYELRYDEAITQYIESAKIADYLNEELELVRIYNNLALSYSALTENEKALEYYRKAYEMAKKLNYTSGYLTLEANIATELYNLRRYEEALPLFKEIKSTAESGDNALQIYMSNLAIGKIYIDQEDYTNGEIYLKQAEQSLASKDYVQSLELYNAMIQLYGEKKDIEKMEYYKNLAIKDNSWNNNLIAQRGIYRDLKDYYSELNFMDSAYKYSTLELSLADSLFKMESLESSKQLEAKYQAAKKDAEISDQKLKTNARTFQRNLFIMGSAILLLLLGTLFYRNRKNKQVLKSEIELLKSKEKLRALDYMVQGQEEERKRIAQDLHDGLGGILASARIQMQKINQEIQKFTDLNLLQKTESLIDNAHQEVRRISHDMMPGALIDLGLNDALEDLVDSYTKSGIQIELHQNLEEHHLTDKQAINLYRIVQEAIQNAVKHAEASLIKVETKIQAHDIILTIEDNGKGFNDALTSKDQDGIGLRSIQSRATFLQGKVDIITAINQGCKIEVSIPLKEQA